jgi:acyl-CoA synthetase (AMP-forming)/AMP-acid ligase II
MQNCSGKKEIIKGRIAHKEKKTGSAKGSMEVYDWMKECFATEEGEMHPMTIFDVRVVFFSFVCKIFWQGYGITEAGGISSNFKLDDNVIPHLVDVPEMGYLTSGDDEKEGLEKKDFSFCSWSDDPPRGLLWVHTPELALGYFADSEKTRSGFQSDCFFLR